MATGQAYPKLSPTVQVSIFGNTVEAIVDTGLETGMQIPGSWKDQLLAVLPEPRALLFEHGLGQVYELDGFDLPVFLDGQPIIIETIFSDKPRVILGVYALQECRLVIDFPAGTVELTKATP